MEFQLRIGTWNVGLLKGKSIELVKALKEYKIHLACIQEIRWRRGRPDEIEGYKMWYVSANGRRNRIEIIDVKDLKEHKVEVKKCNDRIILIIIVVGKKGISIVERMRDLHKHILWGNLRDGVRTTFTQRISSKGFLGSQKMLAKYRIVWRKTLDWSRETLGESNEKLKAYKDIWWWNDEVLIKIKEKLKF